GGYVNLLGYFFGHQYHSAEEFDISPKGYKLLFRVGEWGGQEVPHLHLHLIGGAMLHENIHPIM
ncbi:MAG TPA: HIT domain-containing protein, partial [Candidatus Moranbacteria bacterium]|nr:HIT domain-containing protein [Candidatus Moranbacteria bacterium]